MEGIACHLKSEGNAALVAATREVLGEAKPYSICGSLPLVRNLQRGGFDVQMTGFGLMSTCAPCALAPRPRRPLSTAESSLIRASPFTAPSCVLPLLFVVRHSYHADNEYAKLSDMANGFRILLGVVAQLEK